MTSQLPNRADERMERETLMLALAQLASERGLASVTKAEAARLAGFDPTRFNHYFATIEECVLELQAVTAARVMGAIEDAVEPCSKRSGPDAWLAQLDAGFSAALQFLSAVPAVARTCLVEALALGRPALERRDDALDRCVGLVERLRSGQAEPVSPLAAEMLVRGAFELIHARVARGEAATLPALLPELRTLWSGPFGPLGVRPRRFERRPLGD